MAVNTANRGKMLEGTIESCNRQYKLQDVALINKLATPVSTRSHKGRIVDAFYSAKSTVDFEGVITGGQHIAFDTKQTSGTSLPFKMIKEHQLEYLRRVDELGGQAFLIVMFTMPNEIYRLDIKELIHLKETIGRMSIPYQYFKENLEPIESSNGIAFDYLNYYKKD